jgi:hypothetical protein
MKMTLLDFSLASAFLLQYKRLLGAVAAKPMKSNNDYNEARNVLYKDGLNKLYVFDSSYEKSFVHAVRSAIHGMFIYAKKYKQGYALKASDNAWLCVKALTTPLEEMIPDWVVIDTAVLPYGGFLVCDGLVVDRRTYIGPNMIKSMTQELKTERKKWSSNNPFHRTADRRR